MDLHPKTVWQRRVTNGLDLDDSHLASSLSIYAHVGINGADEIIKCQRDREFSPGLRKERPLLNGVATAMICISVKL
jgi:hypothetical protein